MHTKLEHIIGKATLFIYHHPKKVILMLIFLLAFPIFHLPQIKMDTSTEGFMHQDDPVLLTYNKFRDTFGRDEVIVLGIKNEHIFSLDFLTQLKQLHTELEAKVPYVHKITSLYNVRNTRGEKETLLTDDLLDPFPANISDVAVIKKRVEASHFYKNLLLSHDEKMTKRCMVRPVSK